MKAQATLFEKINIQKRNQALQPEEEKNYYVLEQEMRTEGKHQSLVIKACVLQEGTWKEENNQ